MFREARLFYDKLTYKAKQGAREYEQIINYERKLDPSQQIVLDDTVLKYQIIEEKKDFYLKKFLKSLEIAVVESKEYDRLEIFSDTLKEILTENIDDLLKSIIEFGVYGVYDVMEEVGGSMGDFMEGVENAREMLDVSRKDKKRAARYWANVVWPSENMYEDTIEYRFQVWEDTAPYWYFLEHGNYLNSAAFPRFRQTLFVSNPAYSVFEDLGIEVEKRKQAEKEVNKEIKEINEDYAKRKLNLFEKAVIELQNNPDLYPPGTIFGTYKSLEDERWYKVHVTKTGIVGRALTRRKNR